LTSENEIPAGISSEDFYDAREPLVPGRSCGTCSLCCKLPLIPELGKPAGTWCRHVQQGKGCTIFKDRPQMCRQFFCGWRLDPSLGPEWKPQQSRFILTINVRFGALLLLVDPGMPHAWKREPYYSALKAWAERAFPENKKIIAVLSGKSTVILPDREVELGYIMEDEEIVLVRQNAGYGQSTGYGVQRRLKSPAGAAAAATV